MWHWLTKNRKVLWNNQNSHSHLLRGDNGRSYLKPVDMRTGKSGNQRINMNILYKLILLIFHCTTQTTQTLQVSHLSYKNRLACKWVGYSVYANKYYTTYFCLSFDCCLAPSLNKMSHCWSSSIVYYRPPVSPFSQMFCCQCLINVII